ncbi:MAG: type IV pilus biogenesis/stability protein PilW, partial [Thauera aminoaromatica]
MKSTLAPVVLAVALVLGGCAGAPGVPAGSSSISRPMSDTNPATPADARARVHVELGMAYFEVGRYDVALD